MLKKTFLFISLFSFAALLLFATGANAVTVERSVKNAVLPGETVQITLEVDLENEDASSIIITENIPNGWKVESSNPQATAFEGKIKWLLYGSSLKNSMTLKYVLKAPSSFSEAQNIQGNWKTLTGSGAVLGNQFIIAAEPTTVAPTATPTPQPAQQQQQDNTLLYAVIAALALIIVSGAAYWMGQKKKEAKKK